MICCLMTPAKGGDEMKTKAKVEKAEKLRWTKTVWRGKNWSVYFKAGNKTVVKKGKV